MIREPSLCFLRRTLLGDRRGRQGFGEIAAFEKINPSFFSLVLKLMLLTPAIVEAILDARQLAGLMEPFPVGWREQLEALLPSY